MGEIPEHVEIDFETEKTQILEQINAGDSVEDAVHSILVKRHKQERNDLSRKQQYELEMLKKKAFTEAHDARYLSRNRIIAEYETKMRELGTLDIDDDEYDIEEAKLQKEMKEALDNFDTETERQGDILFDKEKKIVAVKHSSDYLGLLERQMSQVQMAIKECSVDEQIKYEKSKAKRRKRADFDQQMVDREEEMKEREKNEQTKQQRRLERRKQKLLNEAKRQEQSLKQKDEQERKNLEGLVEQKKKQLEISDQNERLAIENSNLDEDEKTRLIVQWEKDQKKKTTRSQGQVGKEQGGSRAANRGKTEKGKIKVGTENNGN